MVFPPLHSHSEEAKYLEDYGARDGFSSRFLVSTEYCPPGLAHESQPLVVGEWGGQEEEGREWALGGEYNLLALCTLSHNGFSLICGHCSVSHI